MPIPDLSTDEWTDDLLDELRVAVLTEQERRLNLSALPALIETQAAAWQKAAGRHDGETWAQPVGAHDAYRKDAVVEHKGKTWVSLIPSNPFEPGVTGWREQTQDGSVPAWVQPTGAHDAYRKGDKVSFEGAVYESLKDSNAHSPSAYPQGWRKLRHAQPVGEL